MKQPGPWLASVSTLDAQTDPELERLFAAARAAVEPTAENRARVTSAVASAVSRSAPGGGEAARAAALRGAGLARTGARVSGKWLAATGALTLALGFWLGHAVGRNEAAPAASPPASQAAARARDGRVSDGTRDLPPGGPSDPGVREATVSAPNEAVPSLVPEAELERAASRPSEPRPRRASGQRAPRREREAPAALPPAATLGFREVLEQLRRARAQLDSGQATMSLLVLSELDRSAGELLLEEREATRVLALCAAGQDRAARAAAERLRASSPRSIYAMRIESSCAAESADGAPARSE
jgi:hypothetical protein